WMMQTMRERGASVVDVRKEPEDKYAEPCRVVDIATARRCATASPTITVKVRRHRAAWPITVAASGISSAWKRSRRLSRTCSEEIWNEVYLAGDSSFVNAWTWHSLNEPRR